MVAARFFLALFVALAFAAHGVVAAVSAHAHTNEGFYLLHAISVDAHDHGHDLDEPGSKNAGLTQTGELPAADHSETGFHSHSTPQFGPNDAYMSLAFAPTAKHVVSPDPHGLTQRHRDKPPFKPPRAFL